MSKKNGYPNLESYYQTENDWHNDNIIELIAEIKEKGLFSELEPVLDIYSFGLTSFEKFPNAPLKVMGALDDAMRQVKFSAEQVVYLLGKIASFISQTEWNLESIEKINQDSFMKIFNTEIVHRKNQLNKNSPPIPEVKNLRYELKAILQGELENLPEYLAGLEPKDKLNFICKLMPFVLPKVQSINAHEGEKQSIANFWD